jgi:hypothetical protein
MLQSFFKKKPIINHEEQFLEWEKNGKPSPPPHIVKQKAIREYQNKYGLEILVETGTYLGEMVEAQKNNFKKIFSIELSKKLSGKAARKFRNYPHITIIYGDSSNELKSLVPIFDHPALFWLDGHYSEGITAMGEKECPVKEELEIILKSRVSHVILIDDARMFNGTHDYPTIDQIKSLTNKSGKSYQIEVKDDIIRLIPKS